MLRDLNINLLRCFVAVAGTHGFARAALRLNQTQPSVTAQIRRLEEIVGRRLFVRNSGRREVTLTTAGERLLRYAERILALNDSALSDLGRQAVKGSIRLGATDDFAAKVLPGILRGFRQQAPNVELTVCTGMTMLMRKEVGKTYDIVLAIQPFGTDEGDVLRSERLLWTASDTRRASPDSVVPLAIYPKGCLYRTWAEAALDRQGRRWHVAVTSESYPTLEAAILQGDTVSVLPESTLPASARALPESEGFPALPGVEVSLYRSRGSPAAIQFGDFLSKHLRSNLSRDRDTT